MIERGSHEILFGPKNDSVYFADFQACVNTECCVSPLCGFFFLGNRIIVSTQNTELEFHISWKFMGTWTSSDSGKPTLSVAAFYDKNMGGSKQMWNYPSDWGNDSSLSILYRQPYRSFSRMAASCLWITQAGEWVDCMGLSLTVAPLGEAIVFPSNTHMYCYNVLCYSHNC